MKKLLSIAVLCFVLSVSAHQAHAQNEGLGLGAMLNGPTGFSYKTWVTDDLALAGGLTFNVGDVSSFYLHTDFLVHGNGDGNLNLESGLMRLYYGAGARIAYNDLSNDTDFGIRLPLGSSYQFEDAPADVFFELVPTIMVTDFNFGLDGALGFRYYLN